MTSKSANPSLKTAMSQKRMQTYCQTLLGESQLQVQYTMSRKMEVDAISKAEAGNYVLSASHSSYNGATTITTSSLLEHWPWFRPPLILSRWNHILLFLPWRPALFYYNKYNNLANKPGRNEPSNHKETIGKGTNGERRGRSRTSKVTVCRLNLPLATRTAIL